MPNLKKQSNVNETIVQSQSASFKSGAASRVRKGVEDDIKQFDIEKKRKAARTIEDMKKIYITH